MYYGNQVNVPGAAGNLAGGFPPPIIPVTDPKRWPMAPGGRPYGGGSPRGTYPMAYDPGSSPATPMASMYMGPQMGQQIIQNAPAGFHNKYVS